MEDLIRVNQYLIEELVRPYVFTIRVQRPLHERKETDDTDYFHVFLRLNICTISIPDGW